MPALHSRADSLTEWLTGASSDNGTQSNASLSLGNYRSSTEAASLGIVISNAIAGTSVLFAGGANPTGLGNLTAIDNQTLTWAPGGQNISGPPVGFASNLTLIVEGNGNSGQYLRIAGTPPFLPGTSQVTLSTIYNNVFGLDNLSIANANSGISEYRATMVLNQSGHTVNSFFRWVAQIGTSQVSDGGSLSSSGAGNITTASGIFTDWPSTGWCQVQSSGGTLKEVVYYSSRTSITLAVPSSGRARLGTTATAGSGTDLIFSVPGAAIAVDPTGVVAFNSSIQTIANGTTAPSGVTWNIGLDQTTGLSIGNMAASTQVGIWIWREIPAGTIAGPQFLTQFIDQFESY